MHTPPSLNADLDLLVLGIENNLALGQRFVADLHRVFPYLHAQAVDAVSYCEGPLKYALGPNTVTLALSQSGQTFNTLDAVKFIERLHRLHKAGPVFVMTGEIDSLMGAAVGQSIKGGAPWVGRVFDNCAGWRIAEPATVTSAATHATLTQLLMQLISEAERCSTADWRPFGLVANDQDVARLQALTRMSVARSAAFFGRTAEGWEVESEERDALTREGRYLSALLIEAPLIFIATVIHLFVMLWLGWNPVIGLQQQVYELTGWPMENQPGTLESLILGAGQTAYFLFAGVAFTLLLRLTQGRPLWDRFFVGRTLVIGDEPYIKSLLAQYVSKLFSLAYEFAGFAGIHAADASSGELLHSFSHRVTRGLILFLGLPDGRWPGRERAEAAICMTSSQVRGVQSMGSGATVIGLGHNTALADKFDRFVPLALSSRAVDNLPSVLRGEWSELCKDLRASRFSSFERLLASYVIFHTAAARTRDFMNRVVPLANFFWSPIFWAIYVISLGRIRPRFGVWDLSRTQSGTRIATTASPVPAINLDPADFLPPMARHAAEQSNARQTKRPFDGQEAVSEDMRDPNDLERKQGAQRYISSARHLPNRGKVLKFRHSG